MADLAGVLLVEFDPSTPPTASSALPIAAAAEVLG